MTCDSCGSENRAGRKFCRECGAALASTCSSCGADVDPGDKFCGECGAGVGAEVAEPAAAEPKVEKRLVSVLFADLVGYTTLSEQHDSEEIRDMLTMYFSRAREIVERFGGTVDKFIGDAVMGVWGATVVREDDAERAVRAALELVDAVDALGGEVGLDGLALRAGVNSGSTAVGPGGNEQGLVVGDLVNVASRLQSIAEPGTVFVGEAAQAVTKRSIDYRFEGERDVKGKTDPLPVWRALRVASGVGGRREDELRPPPFVGRSAEMRLLKDALAAVESEGRARLVSIVGEAGIGKSRLVDEFKNHVDGYSYDVYWHQGRSPSHQTGLTYWALGEMVRQRAGIVESEEPGRALIRLRTTLTEFVESQDDRRWIESRLAGLLGLGEMPPGTRSELFSALRLLFHHIADRGPTVLVFEDMHWGDDGVLDFVTELLGRSIRAPLLIVTLARPDLLERRPGWATEHPNSLGVRLPALAPAEMVRMIADYLPGLPDDVVDALAERAAGVPLYAVELVRMLLGAGDLVEVDGEFRFGGDTASLTVPESLHAVISARIDRLGEEERSVLQDAAVLGHSFPLEALLVMRDGDRARLEPALDLLVRAEALDIEDDPRSPERGQYRFVQSLVREVAYGRLSRPDRRAKHLAVAAHLERIDEPRLAGLAASHIMGAYEASPEGPDREELVAQALRSLMEAAERAVALYSNTQAMGLFEVAIGLALDPEERARLHVRAAKAAEHIGAVDAGLAHAVAAAAHYRAAGDVDGERRATSVRAAILNSNWRTDDALQVIEPIYHAIEEIDDEVTARTVAQAARTFMMNYRQEEAIEAIDRMLPYAARADLTELTLDGLVTRATALGGRGRLIEAAVALRGAAEVAEEAGQLMAASRALHNLSAWSWADNPLAAAAAKEREYELLERCGDQRMAAPIATELAFIDIESGHYERALARLDEFEEEGLPERWRLDRDVVRAQIELLRSGEEDAYRRVVDVLSRLADESSLHTRYFVWSERLDALAAMGRWDEVYRLASTAEPGPSSSSPEEWSQEAVWAAARAAAWTRNLDWTGGARAGADHVTIKTGRTIRGLRMYLDATRAALQGDLAAARATFSDLITMWEPVSPGMALAEVRATFAMLVGPDDPSAAAAAQVAYDWVMETGTGAFLRIYAAGLPASAAQDTAAG